MDKNIILGLIFLVVTVGVGALVPILFPRKAALERLKEGPEKRAGETDWVPKLAAWLKPAAKLTQPREDWMQSRMRRRMINAGYRRDDAPVLFFGAKAILLAAIPLALFLFVTGDARDKLLVLMMLGAALGYFAPNVFLIWRIRERKREIFNTFPDALDLMVVCVEAGLGLDAAIAKVGDEIGKSSTALGEEFHLANLELRAGMSREVALRNLALRTGVEDIDALVAMLIQSDKFGTSVADALRVHADGMRVKRMQRAEETAQKLPVKLVFPVVFLIFPALFLVLLGPSILAVAKMFAGLK